MLRSLLLPRKQVDAHPLRIILDASFAPRPKLPLDSCKIEVCTAFDFRNQRRKLLLGEIDRLGFHIQMDVFGI